MNVIEDVDLLCDINFPIKKIFHNLACNRFDKEYTNNAIIDKIYKELQGI